MSSPYLLGIDTGGTYTDAVLFREPDGVIAKAKSLTTRDDLARGIAGAVDAVIASSGIAAGESGLYRCRQHLQPMLWWKVRVAAQHWC